MSDGKSEFRLTGWHVLAMLVAFFGVVFAVNFYMAYLSQKSWTGLLPGNGYEASIKYDKEAARVRAMLAKGWRTHLLVRPDGLIAIRVEDKKGRPVTALKATAQIGRPASNRDDRTVILKETKVGVYAIDKPLKSGAWRMLVTFKRGGKEVWRAHARFMIAPQG